MIRARLYLPKARWYINAYIAVDEYYAYEILEHMRQLGASRDTLAKAYRNLMSGQLNNGITYSNPNRRETVWVIEITSSAREFFNSVVHEIGHLSQHIAIEMELDQNSEDVCYLSGDIAYTLFPYVRGLLCEHCRKH